MCDSHYATVIVRKFFARMLRVAVGSRQVKNGGSSMSGQRRGGEEGFTLVEVIVAIVLLTITGLAAAQFAITAVRSASSNQQRSAAVSIAAAGVEAVRSGAASFTPADKSAADESNDTAWTALASDGLVSSTDRSDSWLSSTTVTANNQTTFTQYRLTQKCYRSTGSASCEIPSGTSTPSGTPMYRVTIVVTWPDVLHSGKTSSYSTSVLLAASRESSDAATGSGV